MDNNNQKFSKQPREGAFVWDEEIKKLLLENVELSRKTLEVVKKIERRFFWQRMLHLGKWVIIAVFIIFGIWQIQPYINNILSLYQTLPMDAQKLLKP